MGFNHFDYITSKKWFAVRKKVMVRDFCRCVVCNKFSIWNEVHHETYDTLGTEKEIDDCITICREHHEGLHKTNNYLKKRK